MPRRLSVLAVVPLLVAAAACGSSENPREATSADSLEGVKVSGEVGQEPEVEIDDAFDVEETASEVVTEGDGEPVVEGKQASLHIYLANGTSGEKAAATFGSAPQVFPVAEGQIWPAVHDALVGLPTGSRVAIGAVPEDAFGAAGAQQYGLSGKDDVVFVVDVMGVEPTEVLDGPEGETLDAPAAIPTIQEEDGKVTGLTWENAPKKPAKKLQVIPLIEGSGEPVEAGDLVSFNYLGQVYGSKKVFDESYSDAPRTFAVGAGSLIKAWDQGLVGLKTGTRVLIIAPPEFGYGEAGSPPKIGPNATLAFVVDILGVS